MRTKRLANVTRAPELGMQLNGREVCNIVCVEKHVSDGGRLFVYFEWMACQQYSFRDYTRGVRVEKIAHRNKARLLRILGLAEQDARRVSERDGPVSGGDARGSGAQPTLELVHVIRALPAAASQLTEDRVHAQTPRSVAEDQCIL